MMVHARRRPVVAAHSHIARFAAAYPCLNRGADFRSLAKRLANGPRFALDGFAIRVVKRGTCAAAAGRRRTPGCPINRELSRPIEHAVDLARHDEVVLAQSFDLLGAQRHGRVTPAEADIRVMAFGLGKLADALHEGERLPEIAEAKRALDAVSVVAQFQSGACFCKRSTSSRASGGMLPRQGVQIFSREGSDAGT